MWVKDFVVNDKEKTLRRRGRPRSFDRDDALDRAIIVFWEKGYEGASLDDLTKAMRISPPSLYAAFGSKRELFNAAIDRYASTLGRRPFDAFCLEPDARAAVASLFDTSIRCATEYGKPKGCLIANIATMEAENDRALRDKLNGIFAHTDNAIADHLRGVELECDPTTADDHLALAAMAVSVTHSIAMRARSGASRAELIKLADNFLQVLFPQPAHIAET